MRCCKKCGGEIPHHLSARALYCSFPCRKAAEKQRYRERNPDYVARQRKADRDRYRTKQYGRPVSLAEMTKERHREARLLGFRSMLEYQLAEQLKEAGVPFEYEPYPIYYTKPEVMPNAD